MHYYLVCLSDIYYQNKIFGDNSPGVRDNMFHPFQRWRQVMEQHGHQVDTYDRLPRGSDPDGLIFFDIPRDIKAICRKHPSTPRYLLTFEPETIWPKNWDRRQHQAFEKIFTWNDDFVDHGRYLKFYLPNQLAQTVSRDLSLKTKLATLIAGNKSSSHPRELYSKRVEAIRWFEKNHPDEFDLYGVGWDLRTFTGCKPVRALNRIRFLQKMTAARYPSYRGAVAHKKPVLERYKFAICYENVGDVPGYITEKIFDCFNAGCVPVYWGAGNIQEYIPRNCFIDKREYPGYQELYLRLSSLSGRSYLDYLDNIEQFLRGGQGRLFSSDNFADTITRGLTDG